MRIYLLYFNIHTLALFTASKKDTTYIYLATAFVALLEGKSNATTLGHLYPKTEMDSV